MYLQNVLLESGITDYYVHEAKRNALLYVETSLAVSNIFQDLKIWKRHRFLKLFMASRFQFVNAAADLLESHNSEYIYEFKD